MSIGHFGFAVGPYRLQPNDSDPLGLRVYIQDKELVWLIEPRVFDGVHYLVFPLKCDVMGIVLPTH
jgi:hypothetical protein